ncbi:MAG TPA: hypothetical protein VFB14_15330 [Bryobacteraceae bacterium]|nr:hypothetical protein [Bryobacteraceae bacterium]
MKNIQGPKSSERSMRRSSPLLTVTLVAVMAFAAAGRASADEDGGRNGNVVLEWNQVFIDSLVATNTANSVSQRLGAIVHTAIFDAYNGIEQRYTPVFVHGEAPARASKKAAVIAAAYTALVDLFPSQKDALDAKYAASLAALSDDDADDHGRSVERGIDWGISVAEKVLDWRAGDGFNGTYPPFTGEQPWANGGRRRPRLRR